LERHLDCAGRLTPGTAAAEGTAAAVAVLVTHPAAAALATATGNANSTSTTQALLFAVMVTEQVSSLPTEEYH